MYKICRCFIASNFFKFFIFVHFSNFFSNSLANSLLKWPAQFHSGWNVSIDYLGLIQLSRRTKDLGNGIHSFLALALSTKRPESWLVGSLEKPFNGPSFLGKQVVGPSDLPGAVAQ